MNSLVLQPVRVQAALSGLLGLLAALMCGWWLATAGGHTSSKPAPSTHAQRALPKLTADEDQSQILLREKGDWIARKASLKNQEGPLDEKLKKLTAETSALDQQIKRATDKTAEQLEVERLKKEPPQWGELKLSEPDSNRIIVLWNSSTSAPDEQEALQILAKGRAYWEGLASNAPKEAAERKKKQAGDLQNIRTSFDAESSKALARLKDDSLAKAVTDKILEEITKLFSGDLRANPGENFTNSAGIELVWVPEGNFWIGKAEVSEKQYKFVIDGSAVGSDDPKHEVSVGSAKKFVDRLDQMETADEKNTVSPDNRFRPQDYHYDLPKVQQWLDAKSQDDSFKLGLVGLTNQTHEWTSNKRADGRFRSFKMPPLFAPKTSDNDPVAMEDGSAIALLPSTSSSVTARGTSSTAILWSGKLGFRVILIRNEP